MAQETMKVGAPIEAVRVDITPEWGINFPLLYGHLKGQGVRATITLISAKARAQVYETNAGRHYLTYGSRPLFDRWMVGERSAQKGV